MIVGAPADACEGQGRRRKGTGIALRAANGRGHQPNRHDILTGSALAGLETCSRLYREVVAPEPASVRVFPSFSLSSPTGQGRWRA